MTNTEFVYKLNLPSLPEVLTPDFYNSLVKLNSKIRVIYQSVDTNNRIDQKFLNILGYNFNYMTIFLKKDFTGQIHSDNIDNSDMWAINFVHGGICIMEFWRIDNASYSTEIFQDSLGFLIQRYNEKIIKDPIKIYVMKPGAYLVNISAIHRASGIGPRYVVSLRPNKDESTKWVNIIKNFQPIITGIPEQISYVPKIK